MRSHRITAVIYAAAKLDLAEAIGDDEKPVAELARLVSADEGALRRLLIGLATLGLCRQVDGDRFAIRGRDALAILERTGGLGSHRKDRNAAARRR